MRACARARACVCVTFAEKTAPRLSKFGTNVGFDLLYCAGENQPPPAYHSLLISVHFLSLQ